MIIFAIKVLIGILLLIFGYIVLGTCTALFIKWNAPALILEMRSLIARNSKKYTELDNETKEFIACFFIGAIWIIFWGGVIAGAISGFIEALIGED